MDSRPIECLLTFSSCSTYLTTAPPQTITATSISISVQPASTIITTQLVTQTTLSIQPASTITTLSIQPASTVTTISLSIQPVRTITTLSIQPASTITTLSIQPASTVTTLSVSIQPASTITVSRSSAYSDVLQFQPLISWHAIYWVAISMQKSFENRTVSIESVLRIPSPECGPQADQT